jgi:hypothetical protein
VVTDSDKCPGLAASVGYHTTIRPCVGVAQAALALNLFGDRGESAQALRNCILGLCFRELTVEDLKMWERQIKHAHKWPQSMKALRLDKCKEEADRQGVDIPPWYLLDGETGLQVARLYNPVDDTEMMDQQEDTDYAVSALVPSCAIWNLLDTQGEEDTPLLSIADWLKFVVGQSTVDQGALTRIMTRVLLRARWTENLCQALYDGWAWAHTRRESVIHDLERMTDSCDVARRKTHRVMEQLQESRNQSSDLQVEMHEDLKRLEDRLRGANEQGIDNKSQLGRAKEAMVASKARSDRQVAQLTIEKDAAVGAMRELRTSVAELNEALGLSHVEEARLCALGVELREQVAALASEKETNLISWARDKRDRDVTIGALERHDASWATELEVVKAELTRVRSELAAAAGGTSSGQTGGMQVQPIQEDPAVTRLQLGMDTPYVGSALQGETRREREFMGDTRGEDRAVGAGIMLTPGQIPSSPLGFQDPGQSSSQSLMPSVEKPST